MLQKIIAILLLSSLALSCVAQKNNLTADEKEMINCFKGQSLDSTVSVLKEIKSGFQFSIDLFDSMSELEVPQFVGTKQFYESAFPKIDSLQSLYQETELLGLKFVQNSKYQVKAFNQSYGLYKEEKGNTLLKITHTPKAIYYSDGTVETKNISHLEVPSEDAFILIEPWPTTKPIDSIAIAVKFSFPVVMDTISLSTKHDKKEYQSKPISLSSIEINRVLIKYKDFPEIVGYNAFTKNNRALQEHSASFTPYNLSNSDYLVDYQKFYDTLLKKIESKKIKSSKALVSYMEKNIPSQQKSLSNVEKINLHSLCKFARKSNDKI